MLERTKDVMTAGITNIPLTKPAFLYFVCDANNESRMEQIYNLLNTSHIVFHREDNQYTGNAYITTDYEVEGTVIKTIWRNFKSLRPKIKSNWRYLFWEIDNQDLTIVENVTAVYEYLRLPVYIHKTMRGYHFLSVKPVLEELWKYALSSIRVTNPDYPPTTLRIQPNKYIGEQEQFKNGYIVFNGMSRYGQPVRHNDTIKLREWIEGFNLEQLQQNYMIVFYPFPDQSKLESMTIEERTRFQLKQIEESE